MSCRSAGSMNALTPKVPAAPNASAAAARMLSQAPTSTVKSRSAELSGTAAAAPGVAASASADDGWGCGCALSVTSARVPATSDTAGAARRTGRARGSARYPGIVQSPTPPQAPATTARPSLTVVQHGPEDAIADLALARGLLDRVKTGDRGPLLRIYRPARTVA